jgi:hypothetical protein
MTGRDRPEGHGRPTAELSAGCEDSSRLRFETENDAINHAQYLADFGYDWSRRKTCTGIVERYRMVDTYLSLRGTRLKSAEDFALRLFLVPNCHDAHEVKIPFVEAYAVEINVYGKDALVFCWVRHQQKISQHLISTLIPVWPQIDQVIMKLARNAPIRTATRIKLSAQLGFGIGGRERRVLRIGGADEHGSSIGGLIQRASEITYEVNRVAFQGIGNAGENSDFMDDLAGLTVLISEKFNLAFLEKRIASRLELREIVTRSFDEDF